MKHTIEISGGGSVTRNTPPVEGKPLHAAGGPVVHILSEKRVSAEETVWRVELIRISTRQKG